MLRAVNPVRGKSKEDSNFAGAENFQTVTQEICTNYDMKLVNSMTYTTAYEPVAQALRENWPGRVVRILPIINKRASTPHTSTVITGLTRLLRPSRSNPTEQTRSRTAAGFFSRTPAYHACGKRTLPSRCDLAVFHGETGCAFLCPVPTCLLMEVVQTLLSIN